MLPVPLSYSGILCLSSIFLNPALGFEVGADPDPDRNGREPQAELGNRLPASAAVGDNYVAWAQCSRKVCGKWRRLKDNVDPVTLAKDWTCSQNPDALYNSCDLPEEAWDGKDNDIIYAELVPGSIVWAKQSGYPWWPAMVEHDPRSGKYFMFTSDSDQCPSKYHVTFFDNIVTHAWIAVSLIKNFQETPRDKSISKRDFAKRINAGKKMAEAAQKVKIQERLPLFGFAVRYKGNGEAELSEDYSSQESLEIYWNVRETQRSTSREVKEDRNEDSAIKVPIVAKTQPEKARNEKDVEQIDGEPKKRRKPESPVRKELLARPKRFRDPTLKTSSARKDRGETANSSGVKKPAQGLLRAKPKADKASAFGPGRSGPCRNPAHGAMQSRAATDLNEKEHSTEQEDTTEDSFFITQKSVDFPELFPGAVEEKKQEVDLFSDDDMDILTSKKAEQDEEFAEFMFEE